MRYSVLDKSCEKYILERSRNVVGHTTITWVETISVPSTSSASNSPTGASLTIGLRLVTKSESD